MVRAHFILCFTSLFKHFYHQIINLEKIQSLKQESLLFFIISCYSCTVDSGWVKIKCYAEDQTTTWSVSLIEPVWWWVNFFYMICLVLECLFNFNKFYVNFLKCCLNLLKNILFEAVFVVNEKYFELLC